MISYKKYSENDTKKYAVDDGESSVEKSSIVEQPSEATLELLKLAKEFREVLKENKEDENYINEWRQVSKVLDRIFLILFTISTAIMTVIVFIQPFLLETDEYKTRIF